MLMGCVDRVLYIIEKDMCTQSRGACWYVIHSFVFSFLITFFHVRCIGFQRQ